MNKVPGKTASVLALLVTFLAFSFYLYTSIIYKRPLPAEETEKEKLFSLAKKQIYTPGLNLKKIIINLRSSTSRLRYLETNIHLIPFRQSAIPSLKKVRPQILNAIIGIASKMSPADLNSIAGKILLEFRIKKEINSFFTRPLVKNIFFSRFVVQ